MARNSHGWPTQSLKPVGLPPERLLMLPMKCIISIGLEKAECRAGEMQSSPIGTPRAAAISILTFAAGSTPPWPGGALAQFQFDHFHLFAACIVLEFLGAKCAV